MSRVELSHVTHLISPMYMKYESNAMSKSPRMHETCHVYGWVMSHISFHPCIWNMSQMQWVNPHVCIRCVMCMVESCHTSQMSRLAGLRHGCLCESTFVHARVTHTHTHTRTYTHTRTRTHIYTNAHTNAHVTLTVPLWVYVCKKHRLRKNAVL